MATDDSPYADVPYVDRMVEELRRIGEEDFLDLLKPDNLEGLHILREGHIAAFEKLMRTFKQRGENDRLVRGALNKLAKTRGDGRQKPEGSDAKTILRGIIDSAELWKDRRGQPYASVDVETADGRTHREHLNVKGSGFADWVGRRYWQATGDALSEQMIKEATNLARARALYDGAQHATWVRTALEDGRIYIDLADEDWNVIEVDKDGWRVADEVPVRFRRAGDEQPLPMPIPADPQETIAKLQRLLNLKRPQDVMLVLGWMVAAMRPGRPCCILLLICEPGSAKTSALRLVCSVVDPRAAQESSIPPSDWDIAVTSYSVWCVSWDNVGLISADVADACCRIVTGGGARRRSLYTDDAVHALEMRRPMVMTGLRMPSSRSDFVDRSLVCDLGVITDENRRTEAEVQAELEELRPALLGLLLDGVSCALRNEAATRQRLTRLPRMADFLVWVEAASEAFGWTPGEFLAAYDEAYEARMAEAAEDDPLLAAIASYMRERAVRHPDSRGAFEGKAGELLADLRKHLEKDMRTNMWGDRIGKHPAESKWFPQKPNSLSVQLQNNRKPLQAFGIIWSKEQDPHSRTAGQVHRLVLTEQAAGEAIREHKAARERARQGQQVQEKPVETRMLGG